MASESCPICMEDIETQSYCALKPCGHKFHAKCIHKWLVQHGNCPVCRVETYQCQHGTLLDHGHDVFMAVLKSQTAIIDSLRSELRTMEDALYAAQAQNEFLMSTMSHYQSNQDILSCIILSNIIPE